MNTENFIAGWVAVSNAFNTGKYLDFYWPDAILDDTSVGKKFKGDKAIKDYFESYFINYKTQTRLINLQIKNNTQAHLEVEFTGNFPEGKIAGSFDFTFKNNKIAFVKAGLL